MVVPEPLNHILPEGGITQGILSLEYNTIRDRRELVIR